MDKMELNLNEMEMISGGRWSWEKAGLGILICTIGGGLIGDVVGGLPGAAIGAVVGAAAGATCGLGK